MASGRRHDRRDDQRDDRWDDRRDDRWTGRRRDPRDDPRDDPRHDRRAGRRARRTALRAAVVLAVAALVAAGCAGGEEDATGEAPAEESADAVGETVEDESAATTVHERDDELRMNDVQVLGTHNSYKLRLQPDFEEGLEEAMAEVFSEELAADIIGEWDYEHAPLAEQFGEQGIRQIELDIFADPEGGRYAERRAQELAGLPRDPGIPELHEPGFKVMHVHELDVESHCWTFVSCLEEVRDWSEANPGHTPITVLVETKDTPIPDPFELGFPDPLPIGAAELDAVDEEIRSVFDDDHVITPDEVRGDHDTLREAVTGDGWPTLAESRGRILFAYDNTGDEVDAYLDGHPSLEGRMMFTGRSDPDQPEAAFMKINNPVDNFDLIVDVVEQGFLVRTRADSDPQQRGDDLEERRDRALESGAQMVSTDFPVADPELSEFRVQIPDGTPAGCNPVRAPAWCEPHHVESPELLAP